MCGEPVDPSLSWPHPRSASLNHIHPRRLLGPHTRENVELAHLGCNNAEGVQWAAVGAAVDALREEHGAEVVDYLLRHGIEIRELPAA